MIKRILHHISRVDQYDRADDRADQGAQYDSEADVAERLTAVTADEANTVSSRIDRIESYVADPDAPGDRVSMEDDVMHAPVLDIDFPVFVIPSSTPGHFHLYIEQPVRWDNYRDLLDALARCNIIEPGYAGACQERGATFVRLPTSIKPTRDYEKSLTTTGEVPF